MAMGQIQGRCEPRFAAVGEVLAANLDSGLDVGASVAVTVDGELVVDIWGGTAASAVSGQDGPWQEDTIINVWSTTKTMTFLSSLLLVDRGELDLYAPVSRYWPEFAAAGKSAVQVRHLLSHSAGLSGWQEPMTTSDLYDWDKATALLAAQEPWWQPGTASGYHAITQGYLIGEVIRRITGQTFGTFFAKELAEPLGADFHVGTGQDHDQRVARVIPPPPPEVLPEPGSIPFRTLANPPFTAQQSWEEGWRRAEIPAAGGHGNARSVATVQSVLACGGEVGGRRFLSPATCEKVFDEQANGTDLVLGVPIRFGMGYGLPSPDLAISPNPRSCFWGGWGGSIISVDLDARVTIAYMMNRMGEGTLGDERGASLVAATYGALAAV
jgi:CubicO group peptidase (beta-lactamase class C family)